MQNGITLIALVISIIVLIILAGVSIALVLGDNGIATKARIGATNYQNAAIEEQKGLNNISDYIKESINDYTIASDQVTFTPEDSNWKDKNGADITNVKQALDYLYGN